jgi:hypothetical protein
VHDKPGTVKFNVHSETFDQDLDAALDDRYVPIGSPGDYIVLARGYSSPQQ